MKSVFLVHVTPTHSNLKICCAMKSSAKLNEKLDSVLEGKPALVAPSSPTRPCLVHAGRCECADCKLLFDRRPKYFNANVARHVECRERLKRVLKRRRAEKEEEIYSENGSSYYETEESECESEESKVGNQVDERTLEELVEFVQGTSGKKDIKKVNASKSKKKTPRRHLKKERQNSEDIQKEENPFSREAVEKCSASVQFICEEEIKCMKLKSEALVKEKYIGNKRARKNSSPLPKSQAISTEKDESGMVKAQNSEKLNERKNKNAATIQLGTTNNESDKWSSNKLKELVVEDKLSDSTQHESSVETSRGTKSDWAVVSYPKKPCRSGVNEVSKPAGNNNEPKMNERAEAKKKSKLQKTKSSATIVSEMSMGTSLGTTAYLASSSLCSFSNADYSGPVLPTIVLKKNKSKNCERDLNISAVTRVRTPATQSSIPSLLDLNFKVTGPAINCEIVRQGANLLGVHHPSSQPSASTAVRHPIMQDITNHLHKGMDGLHLGNKFGAIGDERKINNMEKKGIAGSGVGVISHLLGGLMDASDEYVPAVCRNHKGYRIEELESSNYSCVEEQRGLPCKFGAIGEERKKKTRNESPVNALHLSARSDCLFQL